MLKRPIRIMLIFFTFCLMASPCFGDALDGFKGQRGTLKIAGGTAHIPVMREAAKRIMTRYSDIVITVAGGGSGVGIKQVGEGLVDIGNSGRKPRQCWKKLRRDSSSRVTTAGSRHWHTRFSGRWKKSSDWSATGAGPSSS